MRFLLLGRHRETGEVQLVSPETYPSRQDALDSLGGALAGTDLTTSHDLLVVDLDAAVPVVLYQAPAPVAAPVEEPIADELEVPARVDALAEISAVEDAALEGPAEVWGTSAETPGALADMLEAAAADMSAPSGDVEAEASQAVAEAGPPLQEEVVADLEPAVAEALAEQADTADLAATAAEAEPAADLADALRRAASHLESQGIVEPPSVEEFAASLPEQPETATAAPAGTADEGPLVWPWEAAATEGSTPAEPGVEDEPEPFEPAAFSEPATAEEVPTVDLTALEKGQVADGPEVSQEPSEATDESVVPAAEPSPVFQPVGIDEPGLEEITLLTPVSGEGFEARPVIIGEYPEVTAPDEDPFAHLESIVAPAAVEDDGAEAVLAAEPEATAEVKAYEPVGTDIAAYTCQDCVYVATCPKANQEGPATCGSFQWTSV